MHLSCALIKSLIKISFDIDYHYCCGAGMKGGMNQSDLVSTRGRLESSTLQSTDHIGVMLQPGLIVCHTTAECLGAIDTPKSFSGDHQFLHLNCQLAGRFDGQVGNRALDYSQGDVTLGYSAGESFFIRHSHDFQNLTVMVSPEALYGLAGDEVEDLIGRERGEEADFFVRHAGQCRKTMRSAMSIANLMKDIPQHRLLLHAATLDFLHWHLSAFQTCRGCDALSPRVCRQLDGAKELLLQDLSDPPTIAKLARAVGMNECKLKICFKKRFGTTIYALFQEERMKKAKRLLQDYNVTETAMVLGYSNVSHFSTAFLKQFGCLPSRVRQFAGAPTH